MWRRGGENIVASRERYTTSGRLGRATARHRWELLVNYLNFIRVMVFCLFCRRTKIIIVTAIRGFKIYIHIQSLMFFI